MKWAYYNEVEPFAVQWLRQLIAAGLIADGEVDQRSISEVAPDDLRPFQQCHFFAGIGGWSLALRKAGWRDDRSAWTGSCPCQPFSGAGHRKGTDDERHLWPEFARLIRAARPSVIFGEQVAGPDGVDWAGHVSADLRQEGYDTGVFVLPAFAFGCPQTRERVYFAADIAVADAAGRSADVRGDWGLPKMEAGPWSPPPWQQGDAHAGDVDDGLPSPLVKSCLRGLGNAIVPEIAGHFIAAYSSLQRAAA